VVTAYPTSVRLWVETTILTLIINTNNNDKLINIETKKLSQAPVTHACIPSYSTHRDQEDWSGELSESGQIVCETLSQKNFLQKRAGGVAKGVDPEFKP
jgi:hypothetical protein